MTQQERHSKIDKVTDNSVRSILWLMEDSWMVAAHVDEQDTIEMLIEKILEVQNKK